MKKDVRSQAACDTKTALEGSDVSCSALLLTETTQGFTSDLTTAEWLYHAENITYWPTG